ncbi:MAG: dihydropteroate synthase [Armatimonadota bacterium]
MSGFSLPETKPAVIGILNVTPDSFSDGGKYASPQEAIDAARRMIAEGAHLIDVGGESTRPGAAPVPANEEATRVLPIVKALAAEGIPVSIDTRKPEVADAALAAGACVLNDVTGLRDPAMRALAARHDATVIIMHMQGEPQTMQANPEYEDVLAEVSAFLKAQAEACIAAGIAEERIWIDPGIGFGKTVEHNLTLLRATGELAATGYPVVIGASRKSFIGRLTGEADPTRRLGGSLAVALYATQLGTAALRVHDVAETVQAIALWRALS